MSPEAASHTQQPTAVDAAVVEDPLSASESSDNTGLKPVIGTDPEKSYAAVAAAGRETTAPAVPLSSSPPHPLSSDQIVVEDQQAATEEDEYTTDSYTEDPGTDGYAEEDSLFSDSNDEGGSQHQSASASQPSSYSESPQLYAADHESFSYGSSDKQWAAPQADETIRPASYATVAPSSSAAFDTHFSSGTTSPNPLDTLNTTRAANALGTAHRFVSQTPWGISTGRLTRDQRHKMQLWDDPNASVSSAAAAAASASASAPAKDDPSHPSNVYLSAYTQPNGLTNGGTSSQHYSSQQQLHYQQQQQALLQMQQQQKSLQAQPSNSLANQVVNVVSVEQGTKGYSQLQDQMQREQRLQQDTMEGKLVQDQRAPRIVTIAQFIKSVSRLLGIGFPSAGCTEARLTVALMAVLGVRTGLDVWFSNFNARCVRAVVTYDRATLLRKLLPEYLGMMLPMAAINQAIKWVISSLTIALRVRLGRYAHERYVDGITNITWNQLHHRGPDGSTPAYERPDWLLTVQIHRFADMFPRLLADVIKPTFDWFVFTRLLSKFIGRKGSITMVLYVVLANIVIRVSSPPTGKHAGQLAQLEEKYRGVYERISKIIQRAASASMPLVMQQNHQQQQQQSDRASSIPSPDPSPHGPSPYASDLRPLTGSNSTAHLRQQQPKQRAFVPRVQAGFRQRAKAALDGSLDHVASSVVSGNIRRFFGGIGETMLVKYGATLTAYYLLSRPLCMPGRRLASEILHDPAAVMMSYSRNSAYLINLSQATTRLLLMVNDLPKFVWSTVRVDRLLRSLDVHARYRSAVENIPLANNSNNNDPDDTSYSTD
ncbi:hypothetical protein LPJ59_003937 [Coemansia sp. RSA 2399]|nr:hypothetical protein LPJ59_003937 [Coemansia sp. RSA 2399]KAJ1894462.1 hypothetical protein LPJ81_005151 [Coemansia sp. IMI 209127]